MIGLTLVTVLQAVVPGSGIQVGKWEGERAEVHAALVRDLSHYFSFQRFHDIAFSAPFLQGSTMHRALARLVLSEDHCALSVVGPHV